MENERSDHFMQNDKATTRRHFLRAAMGGFTLAASGLFLPRGLEQAVAREGANDGQLGGRHGKDRKGRHRRRTHGDRKGKRPAPGNGGIGDRTVNVAVTVQNFRTVAVPVQGWQGLRDTSKGDPWFMKDRSWDWTTIPAKPGNGPALAREFVAEKWNMAIRIGTDRVVTVSGGLDDPNAFIITGGWNSRSGPDSTGELLAGNGAIPVNGSIAAPGIKVTRRLESATHFRFLVELT